MCYKSLKLSIGDTMYCPVCKDERLAISEKNGIEIDYCPKCRGIWLDRGELDKIIERSSNHSKDDYHQSSNNYSEHKYEKNHANQGYHNGYHKKKESFLADLFDF